MLSEPRFGLRGAPFHQSVRLNHERKAAIGRAAVTLCREGESIIIDGGSTTLEMCPYLQGLGLRVLCNSLYVVEALMKHADTRIDLVAGTLFREQNMVLPLEGHDGCADFHARRMFMGATSVGPQGVMQSDLIVARAEQGLLGRAEKLILLVDSSKFEAPKGHPVCSLEEVNVVITDTGISNEHRRMLNDAGIRVIAVAPRSPDLPMAQL
jgi:DeoR family ulaG and ulaABCDEF operon transcriptional repressor